MASQEQNDAFARACTYLNYRKGAAWTAYAMGVITGLLAFSLLVVMWLFADLCVFRGRLPTFTTSSYDVQDEGIAIWNDMPAKVRQGWLEKVGYDNATAAAFSEKEVSRAMSRQELDDVFWRAYLGKILEERVGTDAVARVRLPEGESAPTSPYYDEIDNGVLSLVTRLHLRNSLATPIGAWIASWNPWAWNPGDSSSQFSRFLLGLFGIAVCLTLLSFLCTLLMREMAARAVIEASNRLRRAIYHHTMRLGTLAFRAFGPSEAVTVFTRHVESLHDSMYLRLTSHFREPFLIGLFFLFALIVNLWLALAFLLFATLIWFLGGYATSSFRARSKQATAQAGERLTILRESLMIMRLVKCYLMEQFNQSRVERQLTGHAKVQISRYRNEAITWPLLALMGLIAILILLFVAGLVVLAGQMSLAGLVALAVTLVAIYYPLENWFETIRLIRRGREASLEVFQFLERRPDVGQVVGADFLEPLQQQIEFDNVTLKEPGGTRVLLRDVNLKIEAGQRIGLIGANESEKHALVYLLPRLIDPTDGEIRIDNNNLRWVTLDSLRNQIAIVLQHNLVFHDTVANNIGCGDPLYTLPQIVEAAKMAHIHQFIQKLPQGYETNIGELGHSLRSNQKFLIALARAILRDPALLVIEEPEGEMEEDTKSLLDDTMARLLPGRTTIFLPHRISTIRGCDQLVLLNRGRIAATGQHKTLLSDNPLYKHLYYLEFNEMDDQV